MLKIAVCAVNQQVINEQ